MKRFKRMTVGCMVLAATAVIGQVNSTPKQSRPHAAGKAMHTGNSEDRGQKVFNQNCARCHNSPEGFSPNISGTIAMHMRVRAGLSDADYKALRRFLNP